MEYHKNSGNKLTVTAIQPGGRFGVMDIAENSGKVRGFAEKAKEDGGWINAGFMVAEPEVFKYLDKDISCVFGSTDQSGEIADRYARQDSRIRVIHKERGNIGSGRNAGLDAAQGAISVCDMRLRSIICVLYYTNHL